MKKYMLLGIAILTLGALVAGCGQQTPEVKTTTNQPNGLVIRGVVRNTVLPGTVTGNVGDPLAGATVQISAAGAVAAGISAKIVAPPATTNANGEYIFSGIPDGNYTLIVTKEGYQRTRVTGVYPKSSVVVPADNTITVQDILLVSNPIVLSYSPIPNAVVSNSQAFTITFNEAMDKSSTTFTLAPSGIRTLVTDASRVPITVVWDTASKVATITPVGAMISNETYSLAVVTTGRDTEGYLITATGDQALALTQTYRIATGGLPGNPSDLVISTVTGASSEADYLRVFDDAGTVGSGVRGINLFWKSPASSVISGYSIYVADSATGNYAFLANSTSNQYSTTVWEIAARLYGVLLPLAPRGIDPVCTKNWPFVNKKIYFKVAAFNGDGESTGAASGSLQDSIGPRLAGAVAASWPTFLGGYMNNGYWLAQLTTSTEALVGFNEPLTESSVTTAGFIILYTATGTQAAITVTGATPLVSDASDLTGGGVYTMAKVTTDTAIDNLAGYYSIMLVTGEVKDLAGNAVRPLGSSVIVP